MNQLIQQSNKVYSVDFPALVTGFSSAVQAVGSADAPFYLGQSQILGIVCKTVPNANEGLISIGSIVSVPAGTAVGPPQVNMRLSSTNAADTGVYTLYWTNSTLVGGTLTAGGAPAQPA
jgi:hypothetical protein